MVLTLRRWVSASVILQLKIYFESETLTQVPENAKSQWVFKNKLQPTDILQSSQVSTDPHTESDLT